MFPESNCVFGHPPDLAESQVMPIPAYRGEVSGGSVDGVKLVIVAWLPTAEELEQLNAGAPVYLSSIGGLTPHFLTTSFEQAKHCA
jgi:hypothetical protein